MARGRDGASAGLDGSRGNDTTSCAAHASAGEPEPGDQRRTEVTILERVGYEATTKAIDGLTWPVAGGIAVAVVCVAVIQLLLSGPEADPDGLGMLRCALPN